MRRGYSLLTFMLVAALILHIAVQDAYAQCDRDNDCGGGDEGAIPTTANTTPTNANLSAGCIVIVTSDTSTMLANGTNASIAWQPVNRRANTYWSTHIDYTFAPAAQWIWSSFRVARPVQGDIASFGKGFDLSSKPQRAVLHITADNAYEVSINGAFVGTAHATGPWKKSNLTEPFVHTGGWQTVEHYNVTKLVAGRNNITITAANEYFGPIDHQENGTPEINPSGVIFELEIDTCNNTAEIPGNQTTPSNVTGNSTIGSGTNNTGSNTSGGTNSTNSNTNSSNTGNSSNSTGAHNSTTPINSTTPTNNTTPTNSTAPANNTTPANSTTNQTGLNLTNNQSGGSTNSTLNNTVPLNNTSNTSANSTNNSTNTGNSTGNTAANSTSGTDASQVAPSGNSGGSAAQSSGPYATMGGYCGDGWHKEGGKCVRDPESVKEEAKQAPASKGLDLTNPVAAPPEPQQPDPQQPLDLASHDETRDTGNLVTGNVVGVGRSSWAWLLVLIGVVTIGLSYYAYKKR